MWHFSLLNNVHVGRCWNDSVKFGLEWHFELLSATKNSTSIMPANLFIFSHLSSFARSMYNLMTIHLNKRNGNEMFALTTATKNHERCNGISLFVWYGFSRNSVLERVTFMFQSYGFLQQFTSLLMLCQCCCFRLFHQRTPQRLQCRQINSSFFV